MGEGRHGERSVSGARQQVGRIPCGAGVVAREAALAYTRPVRRFLAGCRSVLVLSAFAACSGGQLAGGGPDAAGDGAMRPAATGLPCDVGAIFEKGCATCHGSTPAYGAPMPLVTWDDLHRPAITDPSKKVYELVGVRIHDAKRPMPQPPSPPLSPDDLAKLDAWIAQGAPRSAEMCAAPDGGGADAGDAFACAPDQTLRAPAPYDMPLVDDQYVCFGVDVPVTGKRHVVKISPAIDNTKIVHHVLLLQSPTTVDPTPKPCSGTSYALPIVYGWAPGTSSLVMPKEAGFPQDGVAHYVVQIHYNNVARLVGQKDRSGFDLCTTAQLRPNDADVVAFGTTKITIPARATLDQTCRYTVPSVMDGRTVIATLPHMHKLGVSMSTELLPKGMPPAIDIGSAPTFTFENQYWRMVTGATMHTGDVVSVRCAWNNPSDAQVKFGEGTNDEMCFSFTMYYPKANLLSWVQPAFQSTCTTN